MLREQAIARLETIIENSANDGTYNYRISANNWEKYGKNRTYLKIVETRNSSKRYAEYDFGYLDNINGEYISGKHDLTKNYNLSGSSF